MTYENRSISSHQEPIMLTFQNGVWRGEMNMYLSYMSRSHGVDEAPFCAHAVPRH